MSSDSIDARTVWLVMGSNRGIGQELVKTIAEKGKQIVIAASHRGFGRPKVVENSSGSKLIFIRIRGDIDADAVEAIEAVKKYDVDHIDVIVANVASSQYQDTAAQTLIEEVRQQFKISTVAASQLVQATLPLLRKSRNPKAAYISTALPSSTAQLPKSADADGASKAAINHIITKFHQEEPTVIAFHIHTGWVKTNVGVPGAKTDGLDKIPITNEPSVHDVFDLIDNATREKSGGKLADFVEGDKPW